MHSPCMFVSFAVIYFSFTSGLKFKHLFLFLFPVLSWLVLCLKTEIKININAIHRINRYPVDSIVCFVNTYPLDSDLSGG